MLQDVSSSLIPPEPIQVMSLVCCPEPQVTEHCTQHRFKTQMLFLFSMILFQVSVEEIAI